MKQGKSWDWKRNSSHLYEPGNIAVGHFCRLESALVLSVIRHNYGVVLFLPGSVYDFRVTLVDVCAL